jgi:hypothetical protein
MGAIMPRLISFSSRREKKSTAAAQSAGSSRPANCHALYILRSVAPPGLHPRFQYDAGLIEQRLPRTLRGRSVPSTELQALRLQPHGWPGVKPARLGCKA